MKALERIPVPKRNRITGLLTVAFVLFVNTEAVQSAGLDLDDIPDSMLMTAPPNATPLLAAVIRQDIGAVRGLLQSGADPNVETAANHRPLCSVIVGLRGKEGELPANRLEIFTLLIDHGARSDVPCHDYDTPLSLAFRLNRRNAIELMLDRGMRKSDTDTSNAYRYQLWKAVNQSDEALLSMLLRAGVHPDTGATSDSPPVLFTAVRYLRVNMVSALLAAGADIHAAPYLHEAVKQRVANTDVLRMLLDAGSDPNALDNDGTPPLVWAAYYDLAPLVRMLLKAGAEPNVHTRDGRVLLASQSHQRHKPSAVEIVEALLDAGADPHLHPRTLGTGATTPFVAAVEHGYIDLLKRYLALGADLNRLFVSQYYQRCVTAMAEPQPQGPLVPIPWFKQSALNGCEAPQIPALLRAMKRDNIEVFGWLIENGADPTVVVGDQVTLLEYAARRHDGGPFVDRLIAAGVPVDVVTYSPWPIRDGNQLRPAIWHAPDQTRPQLPILTAAALGGHVELVGKLISAGADPNQRAAAGATALHCLTAAEPDGLVQYHKAAALLLAAGADLTLHDDEGYSPVTRVLSANDIRLIELILAQEFDVNRRDGRGRAPLAVAIEFNGQKHVVHALLRKGARVGQHEIELARATNFPGLIELVESYAQC